MSSKKDNNVPDEIQKIIESIENDVKNQRVILEGINDNANKIIDMLEIQDENILDIKESQEAWREIAENTHMIATAIATYGEQNMKLIDAVAGKKQVPISVFLLVISIIGVAALSMLVSITDIQLKIDHNKIEIQRAE